MEQFGLIRELQALATANDWKFILGTNEYANIDADFKCDVGQLILWVDINPTPVRNEGNRLSEINYSGSIVLMGKFDSDGDNYAKLDETWQQKYDRRLEDIQKVFSDKMKGFACTNQLQIESDSYEYVINIFDTNLDGVVGTFTINQDRFSEQETDYTLEIVAGDGGTVLPYEGIQSFAKYSKVAIAAIAESNSEFDKWELLVNGAVTDKTDNPLIVDIVNNIKATARFIQFFNLNISNDGNGTTTPTTGIYELEAGTTQEIEATPNSGFEFKEWIIDTVSILDNPYNLLMDSAKNAVAYFEIENIFTDLDTACSELLLYNDNLIPEKGTIEEDADIYWMWTTWKDEFSRDNKVLAYDDDYIYMSYDCGFSYPNRIAFNDTVNIGMSYIFDNGNILFSTKDHIYLSKDNLSTYNEVIVKYPNGDIFTPIADSQNYRALNIDRPVFINNVEYLVWGNYGRLASFSTVAAVYSSIDSGESITIIAQSPSPEINAKCRHTHAINYNPNDESFMMQTGDDGEGCFWSKIQHNQLNNTWSFDEIAAGTSNPDVQSYYKSNGMYFDDTYAYWGSDVTDDPTKRTIFKAPLADITDETKYIPLYVDPAEVLGSFQMNSDGEFIAGIHNTTGNKDIIISKDSGSTVFTKSISSIAQEYIKVGNKNTNGWWFLSGESSNIVNPKLGTLYVKIK